MQRYNKAWASLLTGLVGVAASFEPAVAEHVGEEQIMAVTVLLSTAMVYLVPNRG